MSDGEVFNEAAAPEDDQVANALIAACLMDRDAAERAVELLTPEDMPDDRFRPYKSIFAAVTALVRRGKRPAAPMVAEELRRSHPEAGHGWAQILSDLARSHIGGINVDDYCHILRRYAVRRDLRALGLRYMDLSQNNALETDEYLGQAESLLNALSQRAIASDEPVLVGELLRRQLSVHKARKPGEFDGLKTGFPDVDYIVRGLNDGDMIILAARPSMGKTAFAQNVSDNLAKAGKRPLFVSAEQPDEQIADRIIAAEGVVDGGQLRAGLVQAKHWESVESNLEQSGLFGARYWIDSRSTTVAEIRVKALRLQRQHGLDCIVVDYLQQLSPSRKTGNRVQEVSEISRDLKRLAKELGVPLIVLSQLSRDLEKREDKRPMLSDLRDSGAIEQDADVVVFLYRQSYYDKASTDDTTEVIVAKNRNGPLGMAKLMFIKTRTKFVNLEKRHG